MDLPPQEGASELQQWQEQRRRVETALEESGLQYFRFGRVLPKGDAPDRISSSPPPPHPQTNVIARPSEVSEVIEITIKGLRRAMYPLTHRRRDAQSLVFGNEYDVQDLLHSLLRPWISDIRAEEYTPSHAGASTRMDFLLPAHKLVIETKIIRDRNHARKIGTELILDIDHYRKHPLCSQLWCVIYDPEHLVANAQGLKEDLEGIRSSRDGEVEVRVFIL